MIRFEPGAQKLSATLVFDPIDALAQKRVGRPVRAMGDIRVYAVSHDSAPGGPTRFPPGLRLETVRTLSGYLAFFNRLRTEEGTLWYGGLPAGEYTVEARGALYQPLPLKVTLPVADKRVAEALALQPGPQYILPTGVTALRGSLYRVAGDRKSEPIEGAEVTADNFTVVRARTTRKGSWVLWFEPTGEEPPVVTLTATLPDGSTRMRQVALPVGKDTTVDL